jgi:cytochrome c oxidase subunit 6b
MSALYTAANPLTSPLSYDSMTASHPHMDDPRFMNVQSQYPHCWLRFQVFARCARELGEDNERCKYQYYRAQCVCPETNLEDWMEHRARGTCHLDVLPDRDVLHCRQ